MKRSFKSPASTVITVTRTIGAARKTRDPREDQFHPGRVSIESAEGGRGSGESSGEPPDKFD